MGEPLRPGLVLECTACGARSLPLHTTGGLPWEEGGALVCTWPDASIATGRHEIVGHVAFGGACLPCHYRRLDGKPPAAPGSGAALASRSLVPIVMPPDLPAHVNCRCGVPPTPAACATVTVEPRAASETAAAQLGLFGGRP